MATSHNITEWAQSGFVGLTTKQLREAAAVVGVTLPPNISDENIRTKLLAQLGELPADGASFGKTAKPPVTVKRRASPFDPKPNLVPTGRWGGRWHKVIVSTPQGGTDSPTTHLSIKWESQDRHWSYDKVIHLPEPHFERLKTAELHRITQKKIRDDDNQVVGQENIDNAYPRYNFQYMGVLEGTENLPTSLGDYWLRQAYKTDGFTTEGVTRTHLIGIRSDLYGTPEGYKNPREFYDKMSDDDLRQDIYEWLNFGEIAEAA